MMPTIAVEMKKISKSFGSVVANTDVDLDIKVGEVHALLGENGAGKSTLMNMLSGLYAPDSGSIFIHEKEVYLNSPKDAIRNKIGMIHQHYKLIEVMSAAENISLGKGRQLFVNQRKIEKEIADISKKYGLQIDPNKRIKDMSISEKQTVEIIKVLYGGADILILDEPTAVLTPQETEMLFHIIHKMKEKGCAVIIITHKLNEVMAISDRVTVLRKGKNVGTVKTSETTPKALTDLMVGESVDLEILRGEKSPTSEKLEIMNLSAKDVDGVSVLKEITFDLCGGEILGVAGVAGSGQKELCETIAGLYPVSTGQILYNGVNIVGLSPRQINDKGISMSFIPEDRLGMGLVASMDMVDNYLLKNYYKQQGLFITRKPSAHQCEKMVEELAIKTPNIHTPIRQLSGGNIQKVLLGREIKSNPHFLVTAYATRGLDVGSSHLIYDLLNHQKSKGVGVLYIGEDIDVLLELCDRIMVLCDGEITGIVSADEATKEEIGLMMAGKKTEREDSPC
ncbi:ABC transporter ATP-binding protein [Vallitalea okinawensis]|uniref:ABC transporter ATP-binding protein n=1 Tax=Vallitalea okinawensis TaxID=2078660 RepID=UPI000CFB397A|nr:ABC transporter ATP-binding protein [Vallitalea okinawensis]